MGGPCRRSRARAGRLRGVAAPLRERARDPARGGIRRRHGATGGRPPRSRRRPDPRRTRLRRTSQPRSPTRPRRPTRHSGASANSGLRIVTLDDPTFPTRLAAIEMPPHVLFVLGDPAALEPRAAVAIVGTRRATDHGPGRRRAPGDEPRGGRCLRRVGAGGRHRWRGPRRRGPRRGQHDRGHRIGPRDPASPGSQPAGRQDRRVGWRGRLGARPGRRAEQGHVPAPQPDHQRSCRCHGRRRGAGSQRRTHHGLVGARAGTRLLSCSRDPIDAPASAGCLAFLREFRDATRIVAGIPQLIDDLGLADHLAEPGVTTQAAATLADVGEAAGRLGKGAGARAADRRRAGCRHRLARRERARRPDAARATRSRDRCPWAIPACRPPRRDGPRRGSPAPEAPRGTRRARTHT